MLDGYEYVLAMKILSRTQSKDGIQIHEVGPTYSFAMSPIRVTHPIIHSLNMRLLIPYCVSGIMSKQEMAKSFR